MGMNNGPKRPKKPKSRVIEELGSDSDYEDLEVPLAPEQAPISQMGLPAAPPPPVGANFSQSTTLDSGIANDMKYRLVLKDDFAEDPSHGVIFVNKNVQNQKLTFKVKGVNGDIFEESIKINALPVNDTLDVQKLITHKAAILTELKARENVVKAKIQALKAEEKTAAIARQIAIASELERENSLRLFRNKAELEQAALDKDLKKRLEVSKDMNSVMTPSTVELKDSNAGKIQYLAGLNMEGLAVKMILELFGFAFRLLWAPTAGYFIALKQYEAYAQQYPENVYDQQTLYKYYFDANGNIKLDRTQPIEEKDITLDVILINGYLPKPAWLDQLREASQDYVMGQMGVDLYEDITRAKKYFHGQSDKPSHQEDADNDTQDGVLANRRPPPVPRPTGK